MRYLQLGLLRAGMSRGSGYEDGIHLNFASNGGAGHHYVKVPGGAVTQAALSTLFTFTGDNKSMYLAASGLLVPSSTNTPRIEYDASGNLLGLLVEGVRTNLGLWASDGTQAAWTPTNIAPAKTATGPDGLANSATTLTSSSADGTFLQSVTSASANRAYSVWARLRSGVGTTLMTVNGGTNEVSKSLTPTWTKIETTRASVTNPSFGLKITNSGDQIDVFVNQLESADFASSSIPTTTGSVARAGDEASRAYGTEYNGDTSGTVYAEYVPGPGLNFATCGIFGRGTDGNGRWLYTTSATPSVNIYDGTQANAAAGSPVAGVVNRAAAAFDGTGKAISSNGNAVSTGTYDGTFGGVTNNVYLGTIGGTTSPLFGHIRRLSYWPERKSNLFLQQMTAA